MWDVFAIVFTVVVIAMVAMVAIHWYWKDRQHKLAHWRDHRRRTEGKVIGYAVHQDVVYHNGPMVLTVINMTYEYEVSGRRFVKTQGVADDSSNKPIGSAITVWYSPENPDWHAIKPNVLPPYPYSGIWKVELPGEHPRWHPRRRS